MAELELEQGSSSCCSDRSLWLVLKELSQVVVISRAVYQAEGDW